MTKHERFIRAIRKNVPKEVAEKFDFCESETDWLRQRLAVIAQMDQLLTEEQRLAVMETQGCCLTGKPAAAHRAFGEKYAGKSLEERLAHFDELETPHSPPCRLNDDDTLSVFWGFQEDGSYICVCNSCKKATKQTKIPSTYCGCGGGHARQLLQRSLGVRLKLKKSYPRQLPLTEKSAASFSMKWRRNRLWSCVPRTWRCGP